MVKQRRGVAACVMVCVCVCVSGTPRGHQRCAAADDWCNYSGIKLTFHSTTWDIVIIPNEPQKLQRFDFYSNKTRQEGFSPHFLSDP